MEKGWRILLAVIMLGWMPTVFAQDAPNEQQLPGKDKVSKDLIVLRDSVNSSIAKLSQQDANATDPMRPAYLKMTQDLNRHKIKLDRAIEDVVNNEWNADVRTRTAHVIDDVRTDYKRILSELNQQIQPE
jgi:hypothetical protein